ncbi:MAG: hypothetical protein WA880_10970, partial [Ornithinimicrobium sp.]
MALVLVGFAVRGLFGAETGSAEAGDGSGGSTVTAGQTGSSDDSDATAARPDMGGSDSAEESAAPTEAEETGKAEEEADAEPAGTEMPEALQACVTEVSAGQEWAAATEGSAAHWKRHYGASVKYNAGEITLKQTEDEFAESKAFADSDIKAVSAAAEDYEAAQGACS